MIEDEDEDLCQLTSRTSVSQHPVESSSRVEQSSRRVYNADYIYIYI